ncbi:cob(I)yrinic acid a,c-diamide adenosyltransferase [Alkalibacterium psychrotolerans]|uniref:Corrinoid adenosyltransferase n=1 Tax=Alkalibacterium indicireducens TaxID=398758 RepID=A0ABP3KC70_9LACT
MGIYTKTGDKGETSLFDGSRVKKYSDRVNTYGTMDELNSFISLAEKMVNRTETRDILVKIQKTMFLVSAEIATTNMSKLKNKSDIIEADHIEFLEQVIDIFSKELPKVTSFVLPGKCVSAAQLHVARTVCRRAERELIQLSQTETIRSELIMYLNRLSDCLYILARIEDEDDYIKKIIKKVSEQYEKAVNDPTQKTEAQNKNLYSQAREMMDKAVNKAKELDIPVTIAVVDDSGRRIAEFRMEDALLVSLDLAVRKAYTAVAMKSPTHELKDITQPEADLYQLESNTEGKIVSFGGGLPIYSNGKIIGAIGVSGGSVEEDILIAEASIC